MILREFRGAWRRLAKRPGYAALSVAVLGVGLGLVLFLFSIVNSLILQPLPYPHADRLMALGEPASNGIGGIDGAQYLQLQGRLRSVELIGAYGRSGITLDGGNGAIYYPGCRLTASMLTMLQVQPLLGRGLVAADDVPGAPRVVLLGEALWRHSFQADPHIVGRAVKVDGEWATVVGVMPASFGFPAVAQAWLPLRMNPGEHHYVAAVARLAPGQQLGQARAELDAWAGRLQRALPPGQHANHVVIGPMSLSIVPTAMRRWVWLMFGAGVLVLLLACINVANLQLVQTLQRRHELALRSALGSSRARLLCGALAESLLLSAGALTIAFPILRGAGYWLRATWTASHPGSLSLHHGIDGTVVGFGILAAVLSTVLAGGIPAWRASRVDLQDALRDGSKGSGGGFARVAKTMVVMEVALTVVLLVGAGTFVLALGKLMTQPAAGATHAGQVLTAGVSFPAGSYHADSKRIQFFDRVVESLRSQPGVVDATASDTIPSASLGSHEDVSLPGQPQPSDGWPRVQMGIVDAHFLDTYDVHLLSGRFIDERDQAGSEPVVVIDGKMAAQFWPHGDALNRKLILYPGRKSAQTVTVIGVIEPLQLDSALEKSLPGMLMPLQQAGGARPLEEVGLAMRTHADAATDMQSLISAVHQVDPQVAVYAAYSQAWVMTMKRAGLVVMTDVFSALGLVALLLAAAGLYGVLAFSVEQRTREIGIRRAIGADNGAIVRQVGRQLAWQLGIGLAIGVALALPWSSVLADPNLRTRAHDPAVFLPVLLLVLCVSALAALVPLYRALRVDPAVALRYD